MPDAPLSAATWEEGMAASPARIYDFLLGGKDNYEVDRAAAQQVMAAVPGALRIARANRRFLVRAVSYLAGLGVHQFIDLGTGFPTSPNVHEVARGVLPDARVAYIDNDPVVTAHNRALHATMPSVIAVEGDIRHPQDILNDSDLLAAIDFSRPVAVLFVAVLHFIRPEEDPAAIVAAFRDRMIPGSYLVISHGVSDDLDPAALAKLTSVYQHASAPAVPRTLVEVEGWFAGFKLIRPGLVDVTRWHPGNSKRPGPVHIAGAVGRRITSSLSAVP